MSRRYQTRTTMLAERLKRFRLARGMSLDDLEAAIDGEVSKQALSKYERGMMRPSASALNRIAAAFGVKSVQLWGEPVCRVECLAYRKRARLGKKKQQQLESFVSELLEKRVAFQIRIDELKTLDSLIHSLPISKLGDAEDAAVALRHRWNLGVVPIDNLVNALEDHEIHVIQIDAGEEFDGISTVARDDEGNVLSAAIAVRRDTWGDRHRLNIAHELGHLTLNLGENVDSEKAAFRFGAAFLAPAEELRREFGTKHRRIHKDDLLTLKWRFGLSIQAILYRLKELEIISDSHAKEWWIEINKLGWKKQEPIRIPPEKPKHFYLQVYRALSEGLIGEVEAEQLLNDTLESSLPRTLTDRRAFMQLPTAMRRELLREQAKQMADYYENDPEWRDLKGGGIVEAKAN